MKTVYMCISNELRVWGNHSAAYCILKLPAQRQPKGRREKGIPDKKENLSKAAEAEKLRVHKGRSNSFNFALTSPGQECETLRLQVLHTFVRCYYTQLGVCIYNTVILIKIRKRELPKKSYPFYRDYKGKLIL